MAFLDRVASLKQDGSQETTENLTSSSSMSTCNSGVIQGQTQGTEAHPRGFKTSLA